MSSQVVWLVVCGCRLQSEIRRSRPVSGGGGGMNDMCRILRVASAVTRWAVWTTRKLLLQRRYEWICGVRRQMVACASPGDLVLQMWERHGLRIHDEQLLRALQNAQLKLDRNPGGEQPTQPALQSFPAFAALDAFELRAFGAFLRELRALDAVLRSGHEVADERHEESTSQAARALEGLTL